MHYGQNDYGEGIGWDMSGVSVDNIYENADYLAMTCTIYIPVIYFIFFFHKYLLFKYSLMLEYSKQCHVIC